MAKSDMEQGRGPLPTRIHKMQRTTDKPIDSDPLERYVLDLKRAPTVVLLPAKAVVNECVRPHGGLCGAPRYRGRIDSWIPSLHDCLLDIGDSPVPRPVRLDAVIIHAPEKLLAWSLRDALDWKNDVAKVAMSRVTSKEISFSHRPIEIVPTDVRLRKRVPETPPEYDLGGEG